MAVQLYRVLRVLVSRSMSPFAQQYSGEYLQYQKLTFGFVIAWWVELGWLSSRDPTRSLGMLVPLAPFPSTPAAAAAHLSALALPSVGGAALLPVLAAKFEAAAATFPSGSLDVLTPLLALLLGKRIVLYAVAGATVWLTAVRSEGTADGIGSRLEAVTADAVLPATLPRETAAEVQQNRRSVQI